MPELLEIRPRSDHPLHYRVLASHERIVAILGRIASDIDELARARRVADLPTEANDADLRLRVRRRLAEPPIQMPRHGSSNCSGVKLSSGLRRAPPGGTPRAVGRKKTVGRVLTVPQTGRDDATSGAVTPGTPLRARCVAAPNLASWVPRQAKRGIESRVDWLHRVLTGPAPGLRSMGTHRRDPTSGRFERHRERPRRRRRSPSRSWRTRSHS